jgi:hypothetical protein
MAVFDGPLSPSVATQLEIIAGPGPLRAWSDINNILASDDTRATFAFVGIGHTNSLVGSGFGFSIPDDAIITGILFEIEGTQDPVNTVIGLTKDGLNTAGTVKNTPVLPVAVEAYTSYGGSSDLWGTTWTPAEINSASFGGFFALAAFGGPTWVASIDHYRMSVYYQSDASFSAQTSVLKLQRHTVRQEGKTNMKPVYTNNDMNDITDAGMCPYEKPIEMQEDTDKNMCVNVGVL